MKSKPCTDVYQKVLIHFKKNCNKIFFFLLLLPHALSFAQQLDTALLDIYVPEFKKTKIPDRNLLRQELIYRYPDYDNPRFRYIHEGLRKYFDIDSGASYFHYRYYFWQVPISEDYNIPFEEYLAIRKEALQRQIWD
ncbi:MAG: hypothetical protein ACK4SO_03865, partial [Candidatus Kapaibacteriota bacterium]